ncbi:MAG: alkaline phosphatase family protein [Rhodomicrobium sp.]
MKLAKFLRGTTALISTLALLSNSTVSMAQTAETAKLTTAQKIALIKSKVKYVFVIFHENESFDHFFGTFPGADGLFTAPAGMTPANGTASFTQNYLDTNLNPATISPFLMPQAVTVGGYNPNPIGGQTIVPIYPADYISVDHSHQGMANGIDFDFATGVGANDRYAMNQEGLTTTSTGGIVTKTGAAPTSIALSAKQKAEADISHIDCDTIPFMWTWAKNFVLFDNFHQTIIGPSTPNAIAIIAGQSGETQWALHNKEAPLVTYANSSFPSVLGATYTGGQTSLQSGQSNAYVPVVADPGPFPGSNNDKASVKPPYNPDESATNTSLNLTFASLPLSFMGKNILQTVQKDQNPTVDLADIEHDIRIIHLLNPAVNWGWFQQGFNANDSTTLSGYLGSSYLTGGTPNPNNIPGLYDGYILHHNGPQYFGYLADNTQVLSNNLHGAQDFFTAVENKALPAGGGVFYLRGGYNNNQGLVPAITGPNKTVFIGNDDHPAYADQQISEALAAKAISDIVNSPYWPESAIIITYDETDGFYDHVSPQLRSKFADGSLLSGGPRIPTILISPYAATGTISHQYSEHGSIIKFVNELFGLQPLASLPDEKNARELGKGVLKQANLGPSDDPSNNLGDLTEAFDYDILKGKKAPLSGTLAYFSPSQIMSLPHLALTGYNTTNGYTNGACKAIGILPTDFPSWDAYKAGTPNDPYPVDVNPRPTQSPGTPTIAGWNP